MFQIYLCLHTHTQKEKKKSWSSHVNLVEMYIGILINHHVLHDLKLRNNTGR